ncbi:unnamed protein product [Ectocarpus sp. CCAP 1310/34]|nr:unnamed protein product [Ectocarpus sp. CCAP 1310/34]
MTSLPLVLFDVLVVGWAGALGGGGRRYSYQGQRTRKASAASVPWIFGVMRSVFLLFHAPAAQ